MDASPSFGVVSAGLRKMDLNAQQEQFTKIYHKVVIKAINEAFQEKESYTVIARKY